MPSNDAAGKPRMSDHQYFASYYRWLVASRRLGVDLSGPRILDVGCDDANFLGRGAASLRVGVDMAPRARSQGGVEIVRADARRLPIVAGGFDSILCFDVLEHIEDDRAVMREMLGALSPHGTIWISTPALGYRMFPATLTPYTNRIFGHVRNGYTAAALKALIPDPDRWRLDYFYWNEPLLRFGFAPLHVLGRAVPALAARATRLCYQLDARMSNGQRGHLFAAIRRRAQN
ncbi:MAG TPA: class I SAM-dependent methyltransferase [Roseiflexaceae bacterium]|nr:class I SAM-dependent methyltransferase [Roseiflexaceae bacterium]